MDDLTITIKIIFCFIVLCIIAFVLSLIFGLIKAKKEDKKRIDSIIERNSSENRTHTINISKNLISQPKIIVNNYQTNQPQTASVSDREAISKANDCLNKYVVFDLETTGLHPRKNEIVEIGAVKVEDGVIVDTFSTFVKPRNEITAEGTEINGITNEMLSDAPSINLVLPKFKKFIGSCTLVAHNAQFDCKFLYVACARFRMKLTNKYVDTLEMARKAYPQLENHKLGTLCGYLNIENENAHRALSDTKATQKLFSRLADITPAVAHKIKPIENIKVYDTRLNDSTRNIKELIELIEELSKEKVLTSHELSRLSNWLAVHTDQADEFPASRLPAIMKKTDAEQLRSELKALIKIAFTQKNDKPIMLDGKTVVLDGEFSNGSFEEVSKILMEKGAVVKNRAIKKADYFVIGEFGSPDWAFENYGTSYKKMTEYIDAGSKTVIISEHDFFKIIKKRPVKNTRGKKTN